MKKQVSSSVRKPYSLPVVITADVLLLAVCLSVFCYFHHIRSLWGLAPTENHGMTALEQPAEPVDASPAPEEAVSDDTSDFGARFPHIFLSGEESTAGAVELSEHEEILSYLDSNDLPYEHSLDFNDKSYLGLYRSEDIFMTSEKIATTIHYNSKQYEVTYYIYDVYIRNLENLYTVAVDDREPIEDLALASYEIRQSDGKTYITSPAYLAVNGDYVGNENHTYFAVRNNNIYRDREHIGADICVLFNDGTMETFDMRSFDRGELLNRNPYQVWEFGPSLLDAEGHALYDYYEAYYGKDVLTTRHPRSSIGYYEPGHYAFIIVDGRSEESQGVRLFQLAELYEQLGCKVAYNFDGGDSAQSLWNGEVHRVDEARSEEGEDQRKLYDIVCIGEVSEK